MPGLSGFRDNETGDASANVVTPPPTLVNLVTIGSLATHQILALLATRIPRYRDGGARAHVQRCPTTHMTCGKYVLSDLQPTYQIWTQSVKPFLRYGSAVCTCARAEILQPWIVLKGLTQLWKSRRIYPKYMPKCSVGSTDHVCKFLLKNFA